MINKLQLSLLIGPLVTLPAPPEVIDAFLSAQVTVTAGQRTGFQMTFAVSRKSLLTTTLIPAGYFDPGIRVILVITVNGIPTPVIDGLITRQEVAVSDNIGQSVLTVTGEDVSVAMDLIKWQGIPMPPSPAAGRVTMIIAFYAMFGMIPVVLPELFPSIPLPTDRIEMQQGTHLEYLNKLAEDNGYVFYVDPGPVPGTNTAYWGPEIRIGIPQPALNVDFESDSNVTSLNFSYDGLARSTYITTIQEQMTKLPIPIPIPDIDPLKPPLAIKPAPALRVDLTNDTAKLNPVEALARSVARASASADAVTAQGQLDVARYGHILKARSLVGVRGAGLAYDGLYYVKSVTHNIKRGEYKQSFTLSRDGLISQTPQVPV